MRRIILAVTFGLAIGYALAQRQAAAERAELAALKAADAADKAKWQERANKAEREWYETHPDDYALHQIGYGRLDIIEREENEYACD